MIELTTDAQLLGLLVQAAGAALIGLLCRLLMPAVRHAALKAWMRAWLSLSLALVAMLVRQLYDGTAIVTIPLYLFGEYLFCFWLVEGCAHFGGRAWPAAGLKRALGPFALLAILLPQIVGLSFVSIFMVQSAVLAFTFAAAIWALHSTAKREPASHGLLAIRVSLLLLTILFSAYVPVFAAHVFLGWPLPLVPLVLSSATHLVLEFLVGFGGAVLVLEQSHSGLATYSAGLVADNRNFRALAERDALTGIENRYAYSLLVNSLMTKGGARSGCVAIIDVDGLKLLNDSMGHAIGDMALKSVAASLRRHIRDSDRLFRWGGDEFLIVALNDRPATVISQLDHANVEVAESSSLALQFSYGVVGFEGAGLALAVEQADQLMYASKRARKAKRAAENPQPT